MIDRAGTFLGHIIEHGVTASSGGHPQFVARLEANQMWDDEKGEYVPWEFEGVRTIDGYFVLYTKDANGQPKELMNVAQIKKALGWDGLSFESLAALTVADTLVMFRVEEDEYKGVVKLKAQWLDSADASPTRTLPKFDTTKLKAMTAAFSGVLSASAAPAPVAAPKSAKPTAPPKGKPGPKSGAAAAARSLPAPLTTAPAVAPAIAPAAPAFPSEPVTKASAWAKIVELRAKEITDDKLAETWTAEGAKIGKSEDKFTSEDWHTLQEAVLALVSVF